MPLLDSYDLRGTYPFLERLAARVITLGSKGSLKAYFVRMVFCPSLCECLPPYLEKGGTFHRKLPPDYSLLVASLTIPLAGVEYVGSDVSFQVNRTGLVPFSVTVLDDSGPTIQETFSVASKYVRREIRTLTDEDREVRVNKKQSEEFYDE